jgi:hypothetical protein
MLFWLSATGAPPVVVMRVVMLVPSFHLVPARPVRPDGGSL